MALLQIFGFSLLFRFILAVDLTYHTQEEKPAKTFIGDIRKDSNLKDSISSQDFSNLQFTIISGSDDLFHVDQYTGSLTSLVRLDREEICGLKLECRFLLVLFVISRGNAEFYQKLKVHIYVDDINDNSPEFHGDFKTLRIEESVIVGSMFPLDGAADKDTGANNSVETYRLLPRDSPFSLDVGRKLDGSSTVQLVIDQKLDRETVQNYKLKLQALDGGNPPKTGSIAINILVLDVNDNAPVFLKTVYNITAREDAKVGEPLLRVSATDKDEGDSGRVQYQLGERQSVEINNLFSINRNTGDLTIKKPFNYVGKPYKVVVEAHDLAISRLDSQVAVHITVLDTSNNPPVINVNTFTASNYAEISEYAEPGATAALIAVTDTDTGHNGNVSCYINGDKFVIQKVDDKEYKVAVKKHLDYELVKQYDISVLCADGGQPSLTTSADFIIRVIDENDNAPVFDDYSNTASIEENNSIGQFVKRVSATDSDTGLSRGVTYRMADGEKRFSIDAETGVITANERFDREMVSSIQFVVYAEDGDPKHTVQASVNVIIKDKNDNAPRFNQSTFIFDVPENKAVGSSIGKLNASDRDQGQYGISRYYIQPNIVSSFPFKLQTNGILKLEKELNREMNDGYEMMVFVEDGGNPPVSASATVSINVLDVNDNKPEIVYPEFPNSTVAVYIGDDVNAELVRIQAYDEDRGLNGQVIYFIEGGNGSKIFTIDKQTGGIMLRRKLSKNEITTYSLELSISDMGDLPLVSRTNLNIAIFDEEAYAGDLSGRGGGGGGTKHHTLVAIAVSCITVIIAVAIIVTICIIKRMDRHKNNNQSAADKLRAQLSNEMISELSKPLPDMTDNLKKKKEVSFSFDEDNNMSGLTDLSTLKSMEHLSPGERYTTPPGWPDYDSSKSHKQNNLKDNRCPDDALSDDSRDTIPSDSGRGGSEDDVHSHNGMSHHIDDGRSPGIIMRPGELKVPSPTIIGNPLSQLDENCEYMTMNAERQPHTSDFHSSTIPEDEQYNGRPTTPSHYPPNYQRQFSCPSHQGQCNNLSQNVRRPMTPNYMSERLDTGDPYERHRLKHNNSFSKPFHHGYSLEDFRSGGLHIDPSTFSSGSNTLDSKFSRPKKKIVHDVYV